MARGSRPGERRGGRKPGTPNKANAETRAAIKASGETPLEYMLRVLRDPSIEHSRRDWAADKSAPYCHARLASTEVTGKDGGAIEFEATDTRSLARAVAALLREAKIKKD